MSVRTTPDSPHPKEKFPHGMVRVIPLESFGDGAKDPRQIAREKLPLFEGLLLDGLSDAYRAWKQQKRILKPRKRRATSDSDSKGSKKLPDPRIDADFDSKDPLGLSR